MQDLKAPYSNFGPNIDVSAPGGTGSQSGLFSTVLNNGYNWKQGTSMASPVTAGLLGLVKSYNPQWSNDQIITQVLGSADDIDGINPNYINMLGSGRINAYKALTETGVALQEELRLDLFNVKPYSQDGSGILNPGDTVSLDITMRNFSYGIYANNAGFELICESPLITITMNTHSDTIPADNLFVMQDAFRFVIHDDATTQEVAFKLVTQSNVAIVYGDTLHFELLIAPEGILVFQGIGTGNAYSGDFIYDFLLNQVDNVYFTNNFPADLRGFDLVFISLGNYGQTLDNGTVISEGEAEVIIQYLEDGGDLYVDCGAFFGMIQYLNMPQILDLLELFSLAGFETPLIANTIDSLHGLPGSLAEGMVFTGTTQSPVWYIDKLTPDENGTAVFHEKNYGVVAVQGEGQYGQKTFLISYAISKLVSSIPGIKEQLMVNIAQFFDLPVYTGITNPRPVTELSVDITPNPVSGITNLVIYLPCDQPIQMDLYTLNGRHIKKVFSGIKPAGRHSLQIDMTNLGQGVYILRVQAGNEIKTQKIIKNQ
jgi:serine protease